MKVYKVFTTTLAIFLLTLGTGGPLGAVLEESEFLSDVVKRLASPSYEGRETFTLGSRLSANFIAGTLIDFGLSPLKDFESWSRIESYYFHFTFSEKTLDGDATQLVGRNILAYFQPEDASFEDGYILLIAHYDHLGWTRDGDGSWHYFPGANDNASGVAVLLALARRFSINSSSQGIRYPIVFLFTDAEEKGLQGARAFLADPPMQLKTRKPKLVVNLDTVGVPEGEILFIAGGAEMRNEKSGAPEPIHLFAERVAGEAYSAIKLTEMKQGWEAGDHFAFHQAEIPFVFLFAGAPPTYHKVDDTWEKLDYDFLSTLTNLVFEFLKAVPANSEITFRALPVSPKAQSGDGAPRRAFLGTIPDFSRNVEGGIAISGVVPGSPAEKAGLKAGDIIRKLAGREVTDLRTYSEILKALSPGQVVKLIYERDGKQHEVELEVAERPLETSESG